MQKRLPQLRCRPLRIVAEASTIALNAKSSTITLIISTKRIQAVDSIRLSIMGG